MLKNGITVIYYMMKKKGKIFKLYTTYLIINVFKKIE